MVLLVTFAQALVLPRLPAAEITAEWIGLGYGDWTNSQNWKNGIVPVESQTDQYNVIINNSTTNVYDYIQCSLPTDMAIYKLTLGNVLYVYDPVSFSARQFHVWNTFHWLGGSLSGWNAVYHLHGDTFLEGDTYKTLDRQGTLRIYGNAIWTAGHLPWGGYGQVIIEPTGVLESRNGGYIGSPSTTDSASVSNAGTLRIIVAGVPTRFYGDVINSGLVDVQAGEVQFSTYSGSGAINIAEGCRATFLQASTWGPFTRAGLGELVLSGAAQIFADTIFHGPTRISGGLNGNGNVTFENAVWEGGELSGSGLLNVPGGGSLVIQNPGLTLSRVIVNSGDVFLRQGSAVFTSSSVAHTNRAGALHLASASSLGRSGFTPCSLVNSGSVLKDDGALGTASLYINIQNDGTLRSTAGCLSLLSAITNSGRLEAWGAGSLQVQGLYCTDSSVLLGDGFMRLSGTLRGLVGSNLNLLLNGVNVLNTNDYSLKSLQVSSWVRFPQSHGAFATDSLSLNGSLYGGFLRSFGQAEINAGAAEIKGGSQLELLGPSGFVQGSLSVLESNSTLFTASSVRVLGGSQLKVSVGAAFTNQGQWTFNRQIGSVKGVLTSNLWSVVATNLTGEVTLEDGPCQLSGPILAAPQLLRAGPNARLVFTEFALTNGAVNLLRSSIEASSNLVSSSGTFVLDQATIVGPSAPWIGSAVLTGSGTVYGNLALQRLQLDAQPQTNNLALVGPLRLNSNAVLQITPALSNSLPAFPVLRIQGPVTLGGRFDLVAAFLPSPTNFVPGPVTLLEADQSITGSFTNASSGAVVVATNGWHYRLYYGTDSPYGTNKLVLTEFGSAFDQWRAGRFDSTQLNDLSTSGPAADPDGNGFSNLAEFVLAIDPANYGADFPTLYPAWNNYTLLHLRRRKDIGQLQARLGISTDLRTWSETPIGSAPVWLELHRVLEFNDYYDYTYLYRGAPSALFLKLTASGPF